MKPLELDKLITSSGKLPRKFLADLLEEHGSVAAAARELKITRQALYDQLDKHKVTVRRIRKPKKPKV